MQLGRTWNRKWHRVLTIDVILILTISASGNSGAVPSQLQPQAIDAPEASDEDLLISNDGPVVLPDNSGAIDHRDLLKFDFDACGALQRVEKKQSMLRQSAFAADPQGINDDDDPSEQPRSLVSRWLSRSEIAVLSDAVDKSCDDPDLDDSEDTSQIA